jgi:hypothetical protein
MVRLGAKGDILILILNNRFIETPKSPEKWPLKVIHMDSGCPTLPAILDGMKSEKSEKKLCRVRLEPELEEIAALWPAAKRFEVAQKLKRWAKQLRISALIMVSDGRGQKPRPASVPSLPRRKAALN